MSRVTIYSATSAETAFLCMAKHRIEAWQISNYCKEEQILGVTAEVR